MVICTKSVTRAVRGQHEDVRHEVGTLGQGTQANPWGPRRAWPFGRDLEDRWELGRQSWVRGKDSPVSGKRKYREELWCLSGNKSTDISHTRRGANGAADRGRVRNVSCG